MATWTGETKHELDLDFLLQEISGFILQENGYKILLNQSESWDFNEKHS